METNETVVTLREIQPSEGMMLRRIATGELLKGRTFLAPSDSAENYEEVPMEDGSPEEESE